MRLRPGRRARVRAGGARELRAGAAPPAPRLGVRFFGLFGPQGPMPLHLTEYVRERLRSRGDRDAGALPRHLPPPPARRCSTVPGRESQPAVQPRPARRRPLRRLARRDATARRTPSMRRARCPTSARRFRRASSARAAATAEGLAKLLRQTTSACRCGSSSTSAHWMRAVGRGPQPPRLFAQPPRADRRGGAAARRLDDERQQGAGLPVQVPHRARPADARPILRLPARRRAPGCACATGCSTMSGSSSALGRASSVLGARRGSGAAPRRRPARLGWTTWIGRAARAATTGATCALRPEHPSFLLSARTRSSSMSEISRVALFGKLNPLAYKAIEGATVFCKLRGNPYVELVHWLHQILQHQDSDLHRIVAHFELDAARLAARPHRRARPAAARRDVDLRPLGARSRRRSSAAGSTASLMFGDSAGAHRPPDRRHAEDADACATRCSRSRASSRRSRPTT